MRILLLGEYSNVHAALAKGLRSLGHEVKVASNGDFWKDYPRDIDLARPSGRLGGLRLFFRIKRLLPSMKDFDIVQLINPMFMELKAERLMPIYKFLRRHNKRIILGAFGMDYFWVNECLNHTPLRYSDFNIGETLRTNSDALKEISDWKGTQKEELNKLIAAECDQIVAGLYEYFVCYKPNFPEKTTFIPYPVEMPENRKPEGQANRKIRIFIGINRARSEYKGTDIMLKAAEDVVARHGTEAELIKVESVPFAEYQEIMDGCDVLLDQLYSYTPAMNALLAMSKGIVCVGGGEPENYEILGENSLKPIVNVEPSYESVATKLEDLIRNPEMIRKLKGESREYILKHHEYIKVAKRYETLYKNLL